MVNRKTAFWLFTIYYLPFTIYSKVISLDALTVLT